MPITIVHFGEDCLRLQTYILMNCHFYLTVDLVQKFWKWFSEKSSSTWLRPGPYLNLGLRDDVLEWVAVTGQKIN